MNLAIVQYERHSGKYKADVKFSRKFWFLVPISRKGQMPVLTPLQMPMVLTYHEFNTVCLSSVSKRTHTNNSHSFRIYTLSNNVDLKNNNRNYRKPF